MFSPGQISICRRPIVIIQKSAKSSPSKSSEFSKISNIGNYSRQMWYNVIWSLFFIICLSLCINQTINRVNLYMQNPIVTVSSIWRNSTFVYPFITICGGLNGGTAEIEKFLFKNNWNCIEPAEKDFWVQINTNLSHIWKMVNISKDLNVRATMITENGTEINVDSKEVSTIFGYCQTLSLETLVKPNAPSIYKIFINHSVTNSCVAEPKLLIHSNPDYVTTSFLETSSVRIPHSVSARLVLSAKQFKLLNSTNNLCYGDTQLSKCFNECGFKAILNKTKCKFPFMDSIEIFNNMSYCSSPKSRSFAYANVIDTFRTINADNCKCGQLCNEIIYSSSLFIDDKTGKETVITVSVGDTNIEYVEQIPSYDLISLLCDIGGNLSLYIGVCLLSVLDFIEYSYKIVINSTFCNRFTKVDSKN